ncbi:MAG: tetratricopeptide repeat protein, partial [Candidatus Eremiobacteraeota bacterium]|nr:tetratricopeptide repeat protein [Candidatus Eremiobacteraeota bacterium]
MKKKDRFVLKCILAVVILLLIVIPLNSELNRLKTSFIPDDLPDTPTQMFLSLLGELRYTLAAVLWMKCDHYHHEFEVEHHGNPFKNPPMLQLMKMVTVLDPHFEQAYSVTAYDLAVSFDKKEEALKFINEGIKNNPESRLLFWDKGFILFHFQEYREAIAPLTIAFQRSTKRFDKLNSARLLAHSYLKLGDKARAKKYLKKILELSPDDFWGTK